MAANKRHIVRRKRKRIPIEAFAEKLRNNPTRAEAFLWKHLKKAMTKWGIEFEPQGIVIGRYIADFVCHDKLLICELDGAYHNLAHVKRKDKIRTQVLNRFGYRVVRFSNKVVFTDCFSILRTIEGLIR